MVWQVQRVDIFLIARIFPLTFRGSEKYRATRKFSARDVFQPFHDMYLQECSSIAQRFTRNEVRNLCFFSKEEE